MHDNNDVPEFMTKRPRGTRAFPELDRSDHLWSDSDKAEDHLQRGSAALLEILLRVIQAHPIDQSQKHLRTEKSRLADAFSALTGNPKPNGNRSTPEDDAILLEMADIYVSRCLNFSDGPKEIAPIYREAYPKIMSVELGDGPSSESTRRRLVRKFNSKRDFWCALATLKYQPETGPRANAVTQVISGLEQLSILTEH